MRPAERRPFARRTLASITGLAAIATGALVTAPSAAGDTRTASLDAALADAESGRNDVLPLTERERLPVPEDRYAMASGCYAIQGPRGTYLARVGDTFVATARGRAAAEPFHFRAYDLGRYLLYSRTEDFLAAEGDPTDGATEVVLDTAEGYVRGAPRPPAPRGDGALEPITDPILTTTDAVRGVTIDGRAAIRGTGVVAADEPSAAAEWVLLESEGGAFTLHLPRDDGSEDDPGPTDDELELVATLVAGRTGTLAVVDGIRRDQAARFRLALTDGCAVWPEVGIGVSGQHATGDTPFEEVRGYFDAHLHMMAFEFLGGRARCGRPWHPYGVRYALVDCPDHEPGGHGAVLEAVLSGGNPIEGHATDGWPTFSYWPHHASYTHEQVYYGWLERAWRGGLRMFTNLLVDNGVLCEIYPYKENSCNEMDGVRLQAQRLAELERYIDAQYGGPGEGWFRIVDDPFEARRVINAGKLAVVMGIELSVLFDCAEFRHHARCDHAMIDEQLREVFDLGVRQMELVNKFDNALSGVAGDSGSTGIAVNQGNRYETGHHWLMDTCSHVRGHDHESGDHDLHAHDRTQRNFHDDSGAPDEFTGRDALAGGILAMFGQTGAAPVYPEGPHCNTIGLTELGTYLIDRMIDRGMIFDPDHMSAKARQEALDLIEQRGYTGVVSSHSWADDLSYRRIWELGGVVAPMTKDSTGFVGKWWAQRNWAGDDSLFGLGYGADTNGFASQSPPRDPSNGRAVTYPFTGFGGVLIDQQTNVDGDVEGRTYDFKRDGVAHYGLYPDWIEDIRILAETGDHAIAGIPKGMGDEIVADMERGSEAYLQVWERAIGIAPDACRADVPDLPPGALKRLETGSTPEHVLVVAGQPNRREGSTFTYCTEQGTATVTFGADGTLDSVTSDRPAA